MNLHDILVKSADAALSRQESSQGYMPPGHNGSYHDPETPVRNTAHWLITFIKAYGISGEKKFLDAAYKAAHYLTSSDIRPMGAAFWHRKNPTKDTCNGLIGQAWTIEALAVAAPILEMPELITLAEQVFLLHPYDPSTGLWQRVSVDGTYLDFDYTFNHQLWFAAAGGLLIQSARSSDVNLNVQRFLDCLTKSFQTHSSGLIKHFVSLKHFPMRKRVVDIAEQSWKLKYLSSLAEKRRYMQRKEVGYHSFNLYAFALLKREYQSHPFWKTSKFLSTLKYASSDTYFTEVQASKYGYPYNPPGFEIPFVLGTFNPDTDTDSEQSQWASKQLLECYDFDSSFMNKNTADANTHSARIYEATRLKNLPLSV